MSKLSGAQRSRKVALRRNNHGANFRSQTCAPRFCWRAPLCGGGGAAPTPAPPPAALKAHPLHALPLASRTKPCRRFALLGLSRLQPTSPMFHANCQLAYVPLSRFLKAHPLHAPLAFGCAQRPASTLCAEQKNIRPAEKGPRKEDRRSKKELKTIGPVQKGPRKYDRRKNTSKL